MKNLLILIAIFALCSCVENSQVNIPNQECKKVTSNFGKTYNVVEIDSCEYLVKHNSVREHNGPKKDIISITHKGNCKYCQKRNREMVKNILTAIDYE